jgi:hypothetical protein
MSKVSITIEWADHHKDHLVFKNRQKAESKVQELYKYANRTGIRILDIDYQDVERLHTGQLEELIAVHYHRDHQRLHEAGYTLEKGHWHSLTQPDGLTLCEALERLDISQAQSERKALEPQTFWQAEVWWDEERSFARHFTTKARAEEALVRYLNEVSDEQDLTPPQNLSTLEWTDYSVIKDPHPRTSQACNWGDLDLVITEFVLDVPDEEG